MKCAILGGGPAGCSMAHQLREKGINDITIYEKEEYIGGCSQTRFYENIPYEFGLQVMYTGNKKLQKVFEKFLTQYAPPTPDGEYHPKVSIDGSLKNIHDFPITLQNLFRFDQEKMSQIIFELYSLNLNSPDWSNLENYVISRIGKTLYETYVKNYNIKQWQTDPKNIETEWAKYRTLTLRQSPDMYRGKWQGHPGDYKNLWDGMTEGVEIIYGSDAEVSEDFKIATVNGEKIDADLIFSTLPLSKELNFVNTYGAFVAIKTEKALTDTHTTSFPNNYDFCRMIEFRNQFYVDSEYTLLDFEFPWVETYDKKVFHEQIRHFCKNVLKKEISEEFGWNKEKTYPVSTKKDLEIVEKQLQIAAKGNIIPFGRSGVHAYISKDTCIRMAIDIIDNIETLVDCGEKEKLKILKHIRREIS